MWACPASFSTQRRAHACHCCCPPPQLSLLPEEDPSHQQYELCLADAYQRCGRYQEAVRQYRQLLAHADDEGAESQQLPETRVELLCRLADIQVPAGLPCIKEPCWGPCYWGMAAP